MRLFSKKILSLELTLPEIYPSLENLKKFLFLYKNSVFFSAPDYVTFFFEFLYYFCLRKAVTATQPVPFTFFGYCLIL